MTTPRLPVLLLLLGCNEYKIIRHDTVNPGGDDTGFVPPDSESVPPEPSCLEGEGLAEVVSFNEACLHVPTTGELDAVTEWKMDDYGEYPAYDEIVMTPVVGQLSDDDGDGEITSDDIPDIVVICDDGAYNAPETTGVLRIINGDGSSIVRTVYEAITPDEAYYFYPYRYSGAALGDVNADGSPDIVAIGTLVPIPEQSGDSGSSESGPVDTSTSESGSGGDSSPDDPTEESGDPIRPPPPADSGGGGGGGGGGSACYVGLYDNNGDLQWVGTDVDLECDGHAPAIADLDADGAPEVILGPYIYNGADGSVRGQGSSGEGRYRAYKQVGYMSVAADLDGDGLQEVLAGNTLYDAEGEVICETDTAYNDGFPAAADLDGDGQGDFIVVGDGAVRTFHADCSLMTEWELLAGGNGGPPTVSDFDADGEPEIGIAGAYSYDVYEADGALLWTQPVTDESSHATGSSVHDFEADGHPEVVYGDELTLWIFDGATGEVRLADDQHTSRTLHEYPVIADVDGDNSAEIVLVNGGGHYGSTTSGVVVIGSASDGWFGNRQVWNQHAYSITNINDDLSVPATPEPNWPLHNNFRSGDPNPVSGGAAGDAVPLAEICTEECGAGTVIVQVRVGNEGAAILRADIPVSIYADYGVGRKLLSTAYTDTTIDPGGTSGLLTFTLSRDEIGDGGLRVLVDDDAGVEIVPECVENNNAAVWESGYCGDSDSADTSTP